MSIFSLLKPKKLHDILDFHYEENPDAVLKNLVFGEMNRYEWYLMERKHLNHHFEQFQLLKAPEKSGV